MDEKGRFGNRPGKPGGLLHIADASEWAFERYSYWGGFCHPEVKFKIAVFLGASVRNYLARLAEERGVTLERLVNDLLKKEIESKK